MTTATETASADKTLSIHQFIERHGIVLTATKIPLVSWWTGDEHAQSWECVLKCGTREMSTTFTKGGAHRVWKRSTFGGSFNRPKGAIPGQRAQLSWNPSAYDRGAYLTWSEPEPPTVAEVLDSLVSDASSADQSFEDWCGDMGMDADSRKAEATYNACREIMFNLRKLLGVRDYETLLNDVERM